MDSCVPLLIGLRRCMSDLDIYQSRMRCVILLCGIPEEAGDDEAEDEDQPKV